MTHNVIPIPIACTGSISKELWNEVMEKYPDLYMGDAVLKAAFEKLGNEGISNDEIISNVINMVDRLQKL